ncbi:SGNH/GDSL hydrolase family protein [Primorskyibacter sp. S87]|uniref:SGNH/GDSL hydrolase family protein n=1 Tax=Primorskyibacter sp. S87 TaxID=3415126 RepID=UPI003C7E2BBC
MLKKLIVFGAVMAALASCQESVSRNESARILAIGDSLMTWNSTLGKSVPHVIEKELKEPVVDRAVSGAWMTTRNNGGDGKGFSIPYQYVEGDWDWVVINGGGNDLLFGCGCGKCDGVIDEMISEDGTTGQIPEFLRRVRDDGARVLYFGYLRSPGLLTPIEHCKNDGNELETRLVRFATEEEGVIFATMADVVPKGGLSYFSPDLIHPSRKSSRKIGQRLAEIITFYDTREEFPADEGQLDLIAEQPAPVLAFQEE